jgi:hypothetical protein
MSEIEWYLDELFDQLAGTSAGGRLTWLRSGGTPGRYQTAPLPCPMAATPPACL